MIEYNSDIVVGLTSSNQISISGVDKSTGSTVCTLTLSTDAAIFVRDELTILLNRLDKSVKK